MLETNNLQAKTKNDVSRYRNEIVKHLIDYLTFYDFVLSFLVL